MSDNIKSIALLNKEGRKRSSLLSLQFNGHNVVVHIKASANGEVACAGYVHPLTAVKVERLVLVVDIELNATVSAGLALGIGCGGVEQQTAQPLSLTGGEHIDFVKMKKGIEF